MSRHSHALLVSQTSMQPRAELPILPLTRCNVSLIIEQLTNGVHDGSDAHGHHTFRLQHNKRFKATELINHLIETQMTDAHIRTDIGAMVKTPMRTIIPTGIADAGTFWPTNEADFLRIISPVAT